ncbi:MAG: hypothetical protein ACE5PO_09030, partial [Candidatus Bathyarchaeia archaeon]
MGSVQDAAVYFLDFLAFFFAIRLSSEVRDKNFHLIIVGSANKKLSSRLDATDYSALNYSLQPCGWKNKKQDGNRKQTGVADGE